MNRGFHDEESHAGRRWWIVAAVVLAMLAALLLGHSRGKHAAETSSGAQQALAPEWQDVLDVMLAFREQAVVDYPKAVEIFCNDAAKRNFRALDTEVWTVARPTIGWSWFFGTATFTATGQNTDRPLAAFYNPWADCFVLLALKKKDGALEVAEVEMLPAACIRKQGKPPFDLAPPCKDGFPPESAAQGFVASIRAVEKLFPRGAEPGWRERCGTAIPEIWKNVLHPAASLACGNALLSISEFRAGPDSDRPVISALQPAINGALAQCRRGGLLSLATALPATQKETLAAVEAFGDAAFKNMSVAFAITGKSAAYVFCVNPQNCNFCVAFSCRMNGDKMDLARVDLLDFPGIYLGALSKR